MQAGDTGAAASAPPRWKMKSRLRNEEREPERRSVKIAFDVELIEARPGAEEPALDHLYQETRMCD